VADLEYSRRIFALDEWKSAHRSSKTSRRTEKGDGSVSVREYPSTTLWEEHADRKQVDTVTFRPSAKRFTEDPDGKAAANTWRPIERTGLTGDASLFVSHAEYLFGVDTGRFLDWLAHLEQRPGELPHTAWVHISPYQGTGRNWLASVLCRLWKGYVNPSFDLSGTLSGGFNGSLSQKLLAISDEINEGGSNKPWEVAERLKGLVTEEHRHINPKYGHQRMEYNACRFLIFSNHTTALPLTERDRRFNVVRNDAAPQSTEYYTRLYWALRDPSFIASVGTYLAKRDISAFNPGAHAVMNDAKREMVEACRSSADESIADLVQYHPSDIISNRALGPILTGDPNGKLQAAHRHVLARAGVQAYGPPVKTSSGSVRVSILRNYDRWKKSSQEQIRKELDRPGATT
jgi:hypothetical protein